MSDCSSHLSSLYLFFFAGKIIMPRADKYTMQQQFRLFNLYLFLKVDVYYVI